MRSSQQLHLPNSGGGGLPVHNTCGYNCNRYDDERDDCGDSCGDDDDHNSEIMQL